MILTAVHRYVQSKGLGKVTVSWSIVFVLPMDRRRRRHLSPAPPSRKRTLHLASSVAAVAPRLPQRESRTTCNLGINSFFPFPSPSPFSSSLSFSLLVCLLSLPSLSRAVSLDDGDSGDRRGEREARPSLDHR